MPCQPIAKGENTYPNKTIEREKHKFDAGMIAKCNGCYEVIAINADGKIYPCQALIKDEFQLADISCDNWLKKIADSNITKIFFEDNILSNDCRKCAYKYICGGPCKAAAYNSEGVILGGREKYCDFAKKECNEYLKSVDFGEAEE